MLKNDGFSFFLPYISEPRGSNATFTLISYLITTLGLSNYLITTFALVRSTQLPLLHW